jgi:recombination protein RecA
VDLIFGEGFSKSGEVLDMSTELGLIKKMGSWYEYEGARMGQGRETAKDFLKANPDIMKKLIEKLKSGVIAA